MCPWPSETACSGMLEYIHIKKCHSVLSEIVSLVLSESKSIKKDSKMVVIRSCNLRHFKKQLAIQKYLVAMAKLKKHPGNN